MDPKFSYRASDPVGVGSRALDQGPWIQGLGSRVLDEAAQQIADNNVEAVTSTVDETMNVIQGTGCEALLPPPGIHGLGSMASDPRP